jgi:metallo-beta-lactamase family protein
VTDDATLTFAGGAGTVTGSKYWLRLRSEQLLLDCGLFQGLKALRLRNWAAPPFEARRIDAVVLSHAHLDHSGYLPLLVKRGFRGSIHCTEGTMDLLAVVLRDSAHLHEEDAARANRYAYSKHHPALPLFTREDAEAALRLIEPHPYGDSFAAGPSVRVRYRRAGHILGSATVDMELHAPAPMRLAFSGDLGRWGRPILRDPEFVPEADVLLVESTYGDRVHATDAEARFAEVVTRTAGRGGVLLIPAFAIGRTQELVWTLRKLEEENRIPRLPVFLDSPMAIAVTEIYGRHPADHDLDTQRLANTRGNPLACSELHLVRTADESKALNVRGGPMVLIAGSGMATGGRVLHHLKRLLPSERHTVLLPGYQAAGTRGRSLQDGAKAIRMHGQEVPVRAEVVTLDGFSAHADREEMLRWLRGFRRAPRHTYVVHGEAHASGALATAITRELGWRASVAKDGATVPLARSLS